MTETMKAAPDESSKESSNTSPSTKSAKVVKQANDGNEKTKQSEKAEKPPSKIVVRRLPPTMTLETFVDQVSPLPPVDFMYFVKADSTLTPNAFCRAYLHFIHVDDMLIFTEKFDNYVFVDGKGNEFPAIVEYAPFQRIPKQRSSRKKDPRVGTIESDPYYQEFIDALKAEEAQRKSVSKTNKQHFFETSTSPLVQKITTTPLLEFLKNRRADKLRSKEDRIAERRKREVERRKARDEIRSTTKQLRSGDGDGDASTPSSVQIKIAGHAAAKEKNQKDVSDNSKPLKVAAPSPRQERDRKDKDKDTRKDTQKDSKKDIRDREPKTTDVESSNSKDPDNNLRKSKENLSFSPDTRYKDNRKTGKSYQEERQRLNERRQAAKALNVKTPPSDEVVHNNEKEDKIVAEEHWSRKNVSKKDSDNSFDFKNRSNEKFKGSDNSRHQNSRDLKRQEKLNKPVSKDLDQRRNIDSRKNVDNYGERKEGRKVQDDKQADSSKCTSEASQNKDQELKNTPQKEEVRKKSYSQEREQRRAADKKISSKKETILTGHNEDDKSTDSPSEIKSKQEDLKESSEAGETHQHKGDGDSIDRACQPSSQSSNFVDQDICLDQLEQSKSRSLKISRTGSEDGDASCGKIDSKGKGNEKDKKDPRAERRIRNKDRPSIEIYRPGMGRFSRQRLEREKGLSKGSSTERDSPSSSPSPIPIAVKSNSVSEK